MSARVCVVMTVIIAVSMGPSLTDRSGVSLKEKYDVNKTCSCLNSRFDFNSICSDEVNSVRTAAALICERALFCLTGQNCPVWNTELFLFIYS